MKILSILLILILSCNILFAQNAVVKGTVKDRESSEMLFGVNIISNTGTGTTTDMDGNYELELEPGDYTLTWKFLGYESVKRKVSLDAGESKSINIQLSVKAEDLGLVTVTGSKYEKKFGEESVSMEVLTPQFIENTNSVTLDEALDKVPGVNMVGENINIRGGAGYSSGAGSRVLMLLDGMPYLTPHDGSVEFNSLPIENIKQVEVIKGASSALYGSSALNGIVNVITKNPGNEPETEITTFGGIYENPFKGDNKQYYWSDKSRFFGGFSFVHRRKIKKRFDLTVSGGMNKDQSYLYKDEKNRMRLNLKTRFRPKKIERLTVGLNAGISRSWGDFFFLWAGYDTIKGPSGNRVKIAHKDSLLYTQPEQNAARQNIIPIYIDPFITYFDKKDNKHSLKGRHYYQDTQNGTTEKTNAHLLFGEYTFHSTLNAFGKLKVDFVTGVNASYSTIESEIFGARKSKNGAAFLQIDTKLFDKLTITGGVRTELFKLDTLELVFKPISRFGMNYQIAEATYLRSSYGMGYRYPSIAERFVRVQRAGQYVVPNENLLPESSWSFEMGLKQGFKISNWFGYLDFAGFVTQYKNMMEFRQAPQDVVNEYWPRDEYPGVAFAFWSDNVTNARISGIELSALGQGKIFGIPTNFLVGYTYMVPINLDKRDQIEGSVFSDNSADLNFRFRHTAKADIESTYKKVTLGFTGYVNSFMENIDPLIQLAQDINKFRRENEGPTYRVDVRIGYNFTDDAKVALIAKNVTANQYSIRPGYIEAPRNYTLQVSYQF
ncbi:MAG: TonB-dependent receptor [Chitinophagales bacterium]